MSVVASRVTPTPSDQARSLGTWWWVWTLPAVVAFAVSSIRLGHRQLWRDELATWVAARLSYPELAEESTRVDAVHGPYYALMHAWVGLVGDSEVALRLPSVLAAAVAAGATAEIGRRLYGPYAGLLAGLVLATAPAMSRYAQEARQYSAVVAMVAVATLVLILVVRRPSPARWVAYGAVLAGAGLLHLLGLLVVPAHVAYLLASSRGRRALLAPAFAAWAAAIAIVAPVLWYAQRQTGLVEWIPPTTLDRTLELAYELSGSEQLGLVLCLAGLAGCWPLDRRVLLLLTWALGPFAALLLLSPVRDLLVARYVLFALPAWCLLAAHGATGLAAVAWRWARRTAGLPRRMWVGPPRWLGIAAVALAVAALVPSVLAEHRDVRAIAVPGDSDVRRMAGLLARRLEPGDAVAIHGRHPRWMDRALDYYLPAGIDPPVVVRAWVGAPPDDPSCAGAMSCLDGFDRLWLVNGRRGDDPLREMAPELRAALQERFRIAETIRVRNGSLSLLVPR
ncbi:MAG TPA: glycosyltransferase family 39 protein [Micromonosporaceae bacterium]|nr:glycosyltransferase family 39 protein [Micromonosporaceae bacterium]